MILATLGLEKPQQVIVNLLTAFSSLDTLDMYLLYAKIR